METKKNIGAVTAFWSHATLSTRVFCTVRRHKTSNI